MTSSISISLTIISSIIAGFGGFIFKLAASDLKKKGIIKNFNLYLGAVLFFLAALVYIIALKNGELNVLYPITAFTYVWSAILAKKYLKEKINSYKIAGIALIILGAIVLVN